MTDVVDQPKDEFVAPTILDQLAATTHPAWSTMIDQRRRSVSSSEASETTSQGLAAEWGRRGGTFHKDIDTDDEEFFKK
jgi:hypothetical protein